MVHVRTLPSPSTRTLTVAVLTVVALLAVGCAPDGPTPTPTSSGDASPDPTPTPTQSDGSPSPAPVSEIGLPANCEDIYSAEMLAGLNAANPPLNDPGITMLSTELVEGQEILSAGVPAIRCTWGLPSEVGLATSIAIIDEAQSQIILDALVPKGFTCEEYEGGTLCRITEEFDEAKVGETHYLRANAWVATRWINFGPDGYTEDIIASLWG